MKIVDFFKDMFGGKQQIALNEKIAYLNTKLAIEEFAINTAVNLITGCISKCEFKTYLKGESVIGDEYYLWNIEPNKNQNSSEFIQEFLYKLLIKNECLIIEQRGQLFIADSFYKRDMALYEDYFENVSIKEVTFNRRFKMSEVLYFKLNNRDIRNLVLNMASGYNELLNLSIGKYKRSGGRKGTVELDSMAGGTEETKKQIDELFNKRFKRYFESENGVIHIPKGVKYNEMNGEANKKSTSEIVDIQNLTKEIFDGVSRAYKIPPAILRGDIADVEKITDNLLTFGIDPVVEMIQEEITRKRYGKSAFISKSYLFIDTTNIRHIDIFKIAEKIDKLISSGMYSIDGLLEKVGDVPLDTEWSKKHWITKNYADIDNLEGGDNNEQTNMDDTAIN